MVKTKTKAKKTAPKPIQLRPDEIAFWGRFISKVKDPEEAQDVATKNYVDNHSSGGTTYTAGNNITIENNVISATDTTYSNFTGTNGEAAGAAGLVPAPTTTDAGKYLKADGSWDSITIPQSGIPTNATFWGQSYDSTNNAVSGAMTGAVLIKDSNNHNLSICPSRFTAGHAYIALSGNDLDLRGSSSIKLGTATTSAALGDISASGWDVKTHTISNVVDPTNAQDAATKNYVDTKLTYTTTEQVVGTWIDGKPIYRRVVQFGSNELPSNSTINIADVSSWNIDMAVSIRGMVGYQTGHGSQSVSFRPLTLASGGTDDIRIDIDQENLRIKTFSTWSGFDRNFIIVDYTKTSS